MQEDKDFSFEAATKDFNYSPISFEESTLKIFKQNKKVGATIGSISLKCPLFSKFNYGLTPVTIFKRGKKLLW